MGESRRQRTFSDIPHNLVLAVRRLRMTRKEFYIHQFTPALHSSTLLSEANFTRWDICVPNMSGGIGATEASNLRG